MPGAWLSTPPTVAELTRYTGAVIAAQLSINKSLPAVRWGLPGSEPGYAHREECTKGTQIVRHPLLFIASVHAPRLFFFRANHRSHVPSSIFVLCTSPRT
mmetsp:Transcript_57418/g.153089  ORF Transcript_57418/g.153089 Transcript_57418/m.153089 type:complete len:100 (-) Transcript_57418:543-842(-)